MNTKNSFNAPNKNIKIKNESKSREKVSYYLRMYLCA